MTDILDLPGWTVVSSRVDDRDTYALLQVVNASGISPCFAARATRVSTRAEVMEFIYFPPLVPKGRKILQFAYGKTICYLHYGRAYPRSGGFHLWNNVSGFGETRGCASLQNIDRGPQSGA